MFNDYLTFKLVKNDEQRSGLWIRNLHHFNHCRLSIHRGLLRSVHWLANILAAMGDRDSSSALCPAGSCNIGLDWLDDAHNASPRSIRHRTPAYGGYRIDDIREHRCQGNESLNKSLEKTKKVTA